LLYICKSPNPVLFTYSFQCTWGTKPKYGGDMYGLVTCRGVKALSYVKLGAVGSDFP